MSWRRIFLTTPSASIAVTTSLRHHRHIIRPSIRCINTSTNNIAKGLELYEQAKHIFEVQIPSIQQDIDHEREAEKLEDDEDLIEDLIRYKEDVYTDDVGVEVTKSVDREKERKKKDRQTAVQLIRNITKTANKKKQSSLTLQSKKEQLELQAHKLIEKSALNYLYPPALVSMGNYSLVQLKNPEKAMEFYRAADTGEAWFNVGHILWAGYEYEPELDQEDELSEVASAEFPAVHLKPDAKSAMEAFHRAIDKDDADAMYFVGFHMLQDTNYDSYGKYLPFDDDDIIIRKKRGLNFLRRAGEGNKHPGALHFLSLFYRLGDKELQIEPDERQFQKYLDQAIEAECADSLDVRAHCYLNGEDGFTQNVSLALEDFLEASKLGNANSAVSAGAILHQGIGNIDKDQRKAFELYQYAGELGSEEGWKNVVACYLTGEGVPQCIDTAKYIAKTMLGIKDFEFVSEGRRLE